MRLSNYVDVINGQLISDGDFDALEYCTSLCKKRFLTFLDKIKFLDKVSQNVSCIITTEELRPCLPKHIEGIITSSEPKRSFVMLHNFLSGNKEYVRPDFKTSIGKNCRISPLAYVAEENVVIGDNVEVAPFAVINRNVTIGDNCIIHEHCVVGGKSFNFSRTKDGEVVGMVDAGQVILGNNVEICPHCHIANGPLPSDITWLEDSVKVDAFVHIGHGTKVGKRTLIPAGAQVAGNVVIGEDAWIGVNATIANRITIKDRGRVSLGSVVTKDIEEGQTVTGNFAIEHEKFIDNLKKAARGGIETIAEN